MPARNQPGPYQLQAAISAVHADAATAEQTDWSQILALYDQLLEMAPTPVVALNRAVAIGEVHGPAAALALVDQLDLDHYYLFHATRADLLWRLGRQSEAEQRIHARRRWRRLTRNDEFLSRRWPRIAPMNAVRRHDRWRDAAHAGSIRACRHMHRTSSSATTRLLTRIGTTGKTWSPTMLSLKGQCSTRGARLQFVELTEQFLGAHRATRLVAADRRWQHGHVDVRVRHRGAQRTATDVPRRGVGDRQRRTNQRVSGVLRSARVRAGIRNG